MASPISIPKLGLTMTKATIVKWLKGEGDQVKKGERLVQIETEKVTHVIEASEQGVLLKILVQAKSVAPVGAVIGYIGQSGEAIPVPAPAQPAAPGAGTAPAVVRAGTPAGQAEPRAAVAAPGAASAQARVSPRAKMLALEKNVDVSRLSGRGPMGMIMEEDVLQYIQDKLTKTSQGLAVKEAIAVSPTRRAIAENMFSSLQGMAQVTLTTEVNAFELHKLHAGWPRSGGADPQADSRPTYTDILVKVVADLLRAHPMLNSTLEEDLIKVVEEINIGVAVAAETGLIVPVVKAADKKKVSEISATLRALADKSKTGGLAMDDVMGGTFTITNLGRYDVDAFTPIINPPQAAILGVGRIVERPSVREGKVVIDPTMVLSLTFDHRVMDGHVAATFLKALRQGLENPEVLQGILRLEG